ncbi:phage tail protein I [Pseudoalteromonas luteoviolacea]|uniref:phage tail protein I n=1 Tax=Pseudoalteromonas luteoviolacea TaxID=43657 RepID=UPI001B368017|nr:phage tail protein I [Pseudoalteromonas luteoviolacea]MBQ4814009.1 phage tail protein I [Pseudoalteromonas luteoviolacea]
MRNPSLLPVNKTRLESELEQSLALNRTQFNTERVIPESIGSQWDPLTCPEGLLPWLAWALSVDEWDETWSVETKRSMIAHSVSIHKHKGTVGAVKRALQSLGLQIEFFEWFEDIDDVYLAPHHSGEPHTFTFIAWANEIPYTSRAVVLDQKLYDAIYRVTNQTKPQRTHFDFLVGMKMSSQAVVASSAHGFASNRLYAKVMPHEKRRAGSNTLSLAGAISGHRTAASRHYAASSSERAITAKSQPGCALVIRKQVPLISRQRVSTANVRSLNARAKLGFGAALSTGSGQVVRTYIRSEQTMPSRFIEFSCQMAGAISKSAKQTTVRRLYLNAVTAT